MDLTQFLQSLQTSAGINLAVGFVLSFVAEWIPGFDGASPALKRALMMVLCFVIPVVSTLMLGCYSQDCIWLAVVAGGSAFFGSQVAHVRKL